MNQSEKLKLKRIGERVREVREAKGMSQTGLAQLVICSQNNISKIERGISGANMENLSRIARACDVSEDYLLLRTDFKTRADAVRAMIGQMQQADALWTAFIEHIATYAGYHTIEADRVGVDPTDTTADYLIFEKDNTRACLGMADINAYIAEVTRHAGLSLQMMIEKRRV